MNKTLTTLFSTAGLTAPVSVGSITAPLTDIHNNLRAHADACWDKAGELRKQACALEIKAEEAEEEAVRADKLADKLATNVGNLLDA